MRVDIVHGEPYYLVTSRDDLLGWNILHVEHWKPGVKRLHVMNATETEFRMLYCRTEYLEGRNPLEAEIVVEDILDAEEIG